MDSPIAVEIILRQAFCDDEGPNPAKGGKKKDSGRRKKKGASEPVYYIRKLRTPRLWGPTLLVSVAFLEGPFGSMAHLFMRDSLIPQVGT